MQLCFRIIWTQFGNFDHSLYSKSHAFLSYHVQLCFLRTAWNWALVAPSFLMKIKIFRQMATSIIFYFHRKFWIFKFRLVSVQISIFFSSKRCTTNFKRIFFDLRWVQEVQSFAPLIEERPSCHHRIAEWPRILRSWEKSEIKEKCNMSKLDPNFLTLRMFSKVTDASPFMNLKQKYWQLFSPTTN